MTDSTGAALAGAFYREVVGPLVRQAMPGLRHAAARLGSGSDVLGFDDATSRDHDWGLRLTLLVDEADRAALAGLDRLFERDLPQTFAGRPVRFATTWEPVVRHRVQLETVMGFAASRLGCDPGDGLTDSQWLSLTGHSVLETVGGPVFHDDTESLTRLRSLLTWYPEPLHRYVVAAAWQRVAQSLPFVGRTADTGQELQSALLAGQLARDLMRLAFLLERQWPPYPKWFERGFARLAIAPRLHGSLTLAATANTWRAREDGLVDAIETLAALQRSTGLPTQQEVVVPFWDRPYRTISAAVVTSLGPPTTGLPLVGSIEQWVDNADILARPANRPAIVAAYQSWLAAGTS